MRTAAIRRIQLDSEVGRPAVLALVPDAPPHLTQALAVPQAELEATTRAATSWGIGYGR